MKDISIVIVSYNTKDLTLNCIDSIYKTIKDISFEVIVVDNNSTDGSQEAINKAQKKYSNLKAILNSDNSGFSKGNNLGIKIAEGKFILLLNSDTIVKDNAIERLVEFANSSKDAGVIGAQLLNKDGSVQESVLPNPSIIKNIKQYWLGNKNLLGKYYPKGNLPVVVDAVVGAAFLITPEAIEKVGTLNEKYFMYFEDLEYCDKVRKAGLKVYYLPTAKIVHLHGESGKNLADEKDQWKD